jgi:predicted phage terminase large subunit-like protein
MRLPTLDEIKKEQAQRSLYEFVQQAWDYVESAKFIPNWHIQCICEHLQAQSRGEIENLLINIPPGCSKSLITCVMWPAWEWITQPDSRWFTASYDARLSTRDAVKTRNLISSEWYQANWGERYQIARGQDQKTYYETTRGGYRLATSTRGHGTGEHPDHIVLDDPHDVTGAESAAERQATLDWWDLTMSTRGVSRGVRRTIIMQRLHQSDMSGHVLNQGGWVHICLPMRYEPDRMIETPLGFNDPRTVEGELLTPEQFPESVVKGIETNLGSYGTAGQEQQRPAPREGGMFKRHWFEIVDAAPANANRVRFWDLAASQDTGDYTCGTRMSKTPEGVYYIEDVRREQLSSLGVEQLVKNTASSDGRQVRIWMEQEPGSSGKTVISAYSRLLAGYIFHGERATGSKELRAEPFAAQCEAGNVKLVRGSWNDTWLDEVCLFPNGDHDDTIDSADGAFDKLANRRAVQFGARL